MSDALESMTPEEAMYHEAMSAIQSGDRARARDLFTRLLKMVQDNPDYWIWMSAVVETTKERTFCLKEALRLDPQNVKAKRGLALMGAMPPDPAGVIPASLQKRSWQSKLSGIEETAAEKAAPASRPHFALVGLALVFVIGLVGFAVWGMQQLPSGPQPTPKVVMLPTNTAVLAAETTATPAVVSIPGKPTPLWMLLKATYTPTALYVNTPHTVSEAYRIGQRAYQRGNWDEAETYFKQVLVVEPGAPDVMYYLGEVYRQQGEVTQAAQVFNDILAKNPDFAPAYLGRARAVLAGDARNTEIALKDLETAIELDPNYGEAYLEQAVIQLQAKDPQAALQALNQAAVLLPDSPLVYLHRAQAYLLLEDPEQALQNARRANELDITLLSTYRMIGQTLQAQGDLLGSLNPLNTYLMYSSEDAEAWAWVANAYLAKKDSKEALKALDRSLRLNNRQWDAYLLRAQLLEEQGKAEDALNDYRAVLRFDAESFDASIGVGRALMALKYPGDAYVQFERSMALAEEEIQKAEVVYWRALSLEQLGQYEVAMRDWKALVALPKASVKEEWVKEAEEHIAALVKMTPSPKPKTATPTVTATYTRQPTRTFTPTATRQPTRTSLPTDTRQPTRTQTPTKKP